MADTAVNDLSTGDAVAPAEPVPLMQWTRSVAPGLQMAPMVISCVLPKSAKAMLTDSRATTAPVEGGEPVPEPTFNPAAPEYNELPLRLSQSVAMQSVKQLKDTIQQLQSQGRPPSGASAETAAKLEEATVKLPEAETQLAELRSSFESDPLALAPWTCCLFSLADAGCTTLGVGAPAWPYMNPRALLGPSAAPAGAPPGSTSVVTRGTDQVVGTFKRRFELERGASSLQLVGRWVPNCFVEGFNPQQLVESAVEGLRTELLGAEAAAAGASLDLLLLQWLDYEAHDVVPVLRALGGLLRPPAAAAEEGGEASAPAQPKLRALGLVEPPLSVLKSAACAGVPIACVQLPYHLANTTAAPVVRYCRETGITVLVTGVFMSGLLSEVFLGAPAPAAEQGATLGTGGEPLAAGLDSVRKLGGWPAFQQLLQVLQGIAKREQLSVQAVALRWLVDQDLVPVVTPLGWEGASNKMWAATLGVHPAAGLRQRVEFLKRTLGRGAGSFLTAADVAALAKLTAPRAAA